MNRPAYFGAVTFLLGIGCFSLAVIALATTRWHFDFRVSTEYGLFERCAYGPIREDCIRAPFNTFPPYIRATQAFMIMGTILAMAASLLSLVVACQKGKPKLNMSVGAIFFIAGLFLMVGSAVYTGVNQPNLASNFLRFGYSFWMAWAATVVAFVTVPFAFLAKREKY